MKFNSGDKVIIVDGDCKGHNGVVSGFESLFQLYMDRVPDMSETGFFGIREEEMQPEPVEQAETEEVVDEVRIPAFGMTQEEFVHHLEYLLGRALGHVATVGPADAFFGFQEFESGTASDKLALVLQKIEEAMAMFAQAHILVGRSIIALEAIYGEAK